MRRVGSGQKTSVIKVKKLVKVFGSLIMRRVGSGQKSSLLVVLRL